VVEAAQAGAAGVCSLPVVGVGVLAGADEFGFSGLAVFPGILGVPTTSPSSHHQRS